MNQPTADDIGFVFATQLPRDDGCGVFVLQMLTGKPYDELADLIDWGDRPNHYTTWKELRDALGKLGWRDEGVQDAFEWSEIKGTAIVHVVGDHFILYDAPRGLFYDPGLSDGPDRSTQHKPQSYLRVRAPGLGADI